MFYVTASNMVHMKIVDEPTNYGSVVVYSLEDIFRLITNCSAPTPMDACRHGEEGAPALP